MNRPPGFVRRTSSENRILAVLAIVGVSALLRVAFSSDLESLGPQGKTRKQSANILRVDGGREATTIDSLRGAAISVSGTADGELRTHRIVESRSSGFVRSIGLPSEGEPIGQSYKKGVLGSIAGEIRDSSAGRAIGGVTVRLIGTERGGRRIRKTAHTATDGSYLFRDLKPGTYQVREVQPGHYFDAAKHSVVPGSGGGVVSPNTISNIGIREGESSRGNNFNEVEQASVAGVLTNKDKSAPIVGEEIVLTGTDDLGFAVWETVITDKRGAYVFKNLRPGTYTVPKLNDLAGEVLLLKL